MTRIFDGFLTGLTGCTSATKQNEITGRILFFDRFDRFDRFFPHTHMKVHQSGVQSENGLKPVKPVKTCQTEAVA